jgi:hypothetical protein
MVSKYEARFMDLVRYAPHMNTEKLKVNKFMFDLNIKIHVKVRILMPQTLHDAVQKTLIAEEELTNGGHGKAPARPTGHTTSSEKQHQTPAKHTSRYQDTSRGSTFMTPRISTPQ